MQGLRYQATSRQNIPLQAQAPLMQVDPQATTQPLMDPNMIGEAIGNVWESSLGH